MNQIIEKKCSYLSNFFESAIEQKRLFHSIIFYGGNIMLQYLMALELARLLNCRDKRNALCDCQNCRWIRENKHPAILTISKIDNKSDSSKTVISEEQVNEVMDTLINSSDYHRVFIFCDADIKKLNSEEQKRYEEFINAGYNLPQTGSEDKLWYPSGINTTCFSSVAANSMLKSIEEPPSDVTFIFLTNNKEDLLQTIVSRSQAFYIGYVSSQTYNIDFLEKYFNNYPNFDKSQVLNFAKNLYSYQITNSLEPNYILDCLQYYLLQIAKANFDNKIILNFIFKDIEKIEDAKKMIKAYIKEQTVYENLGFYFCRK